MKRKYSLLPEISQDFISGQDYFFLFETSLFDKENFLSYIFFNPIDIIKVESYGDVPLAFERMERYAKKYYLAGTFSYELGYFFENQGLQAAQPFPLIHLGVFDKVTVFDHRGKTRFAGASGVFSKRNAVNSYSVQGLKLSFEKGQYAQCLRRIKSYIERGDTYQVNFTGKYLFNFSGSAAGFYGYLKEKQPVPYGSFCKLGDEYVLSFSPELFFRRKGRIICSKPMKGTMPRGKNGREDRQHLLRLKNSRKNLAENLMIADLIRNDLGRICEPGSVKVTRPFAVEKYSSLFQMTSTVRGNLKKGVTYFEIFKSLFPGGSVTGAPKIRTMEIIRGLEKAPRNLYCGALGMIFPHHKAIFNLPIRTISLRGGKGEMGVGSGIVYDSNQKTEFEECLLKARFLTQERPSFKLLETILWDNGYKFLPEHLKRLRDSTEYFNFLFDKPKVLLALQRIARKFLKPSRYKIRLLLDKEGVARAEFSKIKAEKQELENRAAISRYKTDPDSLFYYHKTTHRSLYDSEYKYYSSLGYSDVLFLNKKNEITEGAISNIIIKRHGKLYTPPVFSGLLPGIFRGYLMRKHKVREKTLFLKDLLGADKVFLCNSVRGLTEVKVVKDA